MIRSRNYTHLHHTGFTLVEMIVSLAIFSFVVTMSVGSLIVLLNSNRQMQEEQGVMTNLSFVLDAITREIRVGHGYVCIGATSEDGIVQGLSGNLRVFDPSRNDHDSMGPEVTKDCSTSGPGSMVNNLEFRGISIVEGGDSVTGPAYHRILYYYDHPARTIKRRVGNLAPETMLSTGIRIEDFRIYVTGSYTLSNPAGGNDIVQPTVSIAVRATETNDPSKIYELSTTVTQRMLDL